MSTAISWTDETWNPTTGCHKVSSGCANCYAAALAPRLAAMGQHGYTDLPWTKKNAEENVFLHSERLDKPLKWKKPRRVFVNSMSDLFHELVPDDFIRRVWRVMLEARQHTFQVLTKRPERMASWVEENVYGPAEFGDWTLTGIGGDTVPNVWLGTSVENQAAADERIPHLLDTTAAVRFLSCEPLIGRVDLCEPLGIWWNQTTDDWIKERESPIHWIIAGGESGPNFRTMNPEWACSLREQCLGAGVPFFFKQSSGLRPETGALLDGEEWHQTPELAHEAGRERSFRG